MGLFPGNGKAIFSSLRLFFYRGYALCHFSERGCFLFMDALNDLNQLFLRNLETKYVRTVFDLWFRDLVLEKMDDKNAVFSINSDFKRDVLDKKYKTVIKDAMEEVIGFPIAVSFTSTEHGETAIDRYLRQKEEEAKKEAEKPVEPIQSEDEKFKQAIEGHSLVEEYTFGNFVVGESNKFAHAACWAVAACPSLGPSTGTRYSGSANAGPDDPIFTYNPLFIHGPSGLGKTHLLYAITNEIKKKKSNVKIVYKKCEDFTNEMIGAIKSGTMPAFREKYRSSDVLLIDDIQFIAGKESTQEEFFHTFTALYESEKQIILTSDRPPKDISPLEDRLRTRFEWGLIADIQPPSEELRAAIIRQKAESMHVTVPEDAIAFLTESLQKDIRQIEGAIKKIAAISSITSTPINIDMCRRAIGDIVSGEEPAPVTVDRILRVVSEKFGVSCADIKGRKRSENIASARHMCVYLIRQLTSLSLMDIGAIFARDHTTTINSIRKIESERGNGSPTDMLINELTEKIKN